MSCGLPTIGRQMRTQYTPAVMRSIQAARALDTLHSSVTFSLATEGLR